MKTIAIHLQAIAGKFLPVCLLLSVTLCATGKDFYGYTKDRPLVIASDWDFQPFEFLSNEGRPTGYNVDVLNLILDKLEIPHKFVMQEWYLATEMFENHDADLIHALSFAYKGHPYVMTKKYINYYSLKCARRLDVPPLHTLKNLGEHDVLMLKNNDYAALRVKQMGEMPFSIEYHSPKDALTSIRHRRGKYFIWGEVPLESKMRELSLDSVILDEIDIPAGELRIIGYDKDLIDIIDDEYTRLEQNGELEAIRIKWFHPEQANGKASPIAFIIIIGLVVASIIIFLLSRLITLRVKAAVRQSADINNMMTTALKMGEYYIIEHDLLTGVFSNVYGNLLPPDCKTEKDFTERFPPEVRDALMHQTDALKDGTSKEFSMSERWNVGTIEAPVWRNFEGRTFAEYEDGRLRYLLCAMKDVTHDIEEEHKNQELWNMYRNLFETNIVGMSFYDKDGRLLDANEKMMEICNFGENAEELFRNSNLFDFPTVEGDFLLQTHETLHSCHHLHIPEFNLNKYLEMRIKPVLDSNDELVYYVITSRDVSEERTMYMEQLRHNAEISRVNQATLFYENQLHYLLEQSNMFIWYYDPQADRITYTRSPNERKYTETLDKLFAGVTDETRAEALAGVRECVAKGEIYNTIHHYQYTPLEQHPVWYAISGIPTYDAKGRLIEYFGISRNITDLMNAQEKLRIETARAEDSGRLKAAFLANMTHEIRTPLNSIVGFSDILQMVEAPEERMEFIRIIRNNCDMLLRLINDILEASSMGQALAIEPSHIDFSQVFDDICQTLEQRVAEAGVPFIKDNPYPTFPAYLDKGRVQQVLTNFTTNAVKYTKTGHIKVGYREQDGGIYFYCEDTGAGIPKDKQAAVFERFVKLNDFVQGTGLGLSICKSIAERCNGKIGVTSEGEGHGSTFWFWIPQ